MGSEFIVRMSCLSCGGGLEISKDIDQFVCTYCGTEQRVERKGGTIALKRVADAIAKVQVGTDKTAAELALYRLPHELNTLMWHRNQRVTYWQYELAKPRGTADAYVLLGLFLCLTAIAVVTSILFDLAGSYVALIGCVLSIGASAAGFFAIRAWAYESITEEIQSLNRRKTSDLTAIDNQIKTLSEKIENARAIANS
jgi:hypothetical protein